MQDSKSDLKSNLKPACWLSPRHILIPIEEVKTCLSVAFTWFESQGYDVERELHSVRGCAWGDYSSCCFSLDAYTSTPLKDVEREGVLEFSTTRGCVVLLNQIWDNLRTHLRGDPPPVQFEPDSLNLQIEDAMVLSAMAQSDPCGDGGHQSLQLLSAAAASSMRNLFVAMVAWPQIITWTLDTLLSGAVPFETTHAMCKLIATSVCSGIELAEFNVDKLVKVLQSLDKRDVRFRSSVRYCTKARDQSKRDSRMRFGAGSSVSDAAPLPLPLPPESSRGLDLPDNFGEPLGEPFGELCESSPHRSASEDSTLSDTE